MYFLFNRREVCILVQAQMRLPKTKSGATLRIYRTENAFEFNSKDMQRTNMAHGTTYQNNTPHDPQESCTVERIDQTLMNAARAALNHAGLNPTFRKDAFIDAAYKNNLM